MKKSYRVPHFVQSKKKRRHYLIKLFLNINFQNRYIWLAQAISEYRVLGVIMSRHVGK